MLYELREYTATPDGEPRLQRMVTEHMLGLFERHGLTLVGFWRHADEPRRFVYLLAWPDDDAMRSSWEAFLADEEWRQIKRDTTAAHGDLVGEIDEMILVPTDFSPSI